MALVAPGLSAHIVNITDVTSAVVNCSTLADVPSQETCLAVKWERQFVLPTWVQLIYASLFGCMIIVAAFGNAIVVWIILAHRKMRSVTNYFLLNLSLADTITATFNTTFSLVFMLESHWAFGNAYCVFSNFVANLTVGSSSLTIAAMSVDRYFAIVRPLCRRLPRWLAITVICAIWGSSALLSLPALLYSGTRSFEYADGSTRIVCMLQWPGYDPPVVPYVDYVYNIVFLVLTYVVPVITMAVTYTRMGFVLWGSRCIGEATELQKAALRNKQKVVRMLITVVTLFSVSWLPYHIYFLFIFHHPAAVYSDYIQHAYLVMYWLAMSHAMYNPIIYYFMNKRFNTYFKRVLCFCLPSIIAGNGTSPNAVGQNHDISRTRSQRTTTFKAQFRKSMSTERFDDGRNGSLREINLDNVS